MFLGGLRIKIANKAFTLSELLIVLAVIAIIATFTITKLLSSSGTVVDQSKWKETIGVISNVAMNGYGTAALRPGINRSAVYNYFLQNMNYVKACPSDCSTEGCASGYLIVDFNTNDPGFVLMNGAVFTIFDIQNSGCGTSSIISMLIDINGEYLPNQTNVDQMEVKLNMTNAFCNNQRPGILGPHTTKGRPLWDEIFTP